MPTADEPDAQDAPRGQSPNGDAKQPSQRDGLRGFGPTLARLTMVGWFVAASIVVGAIAGWWLDSLLGTAPWILISGVLLGVAVAMVGMVRMLQRVGSE